MQCRATQDGWVMVESSDKAWSTGEGNGKPLQYSYLENPLNSMKRQKDGDTSMEILGIYKEVWPGAELKSLQSSSSLESSGEITPERMKGWSQSKNNTQLWM